MGLKDTESIGGEVILILRLIENQPLHFGIVLLRISNFSHKSSLFIFRLGYLKKSYGLSSHLLLKNSSLEIKEKIMLFPAFDEKHAIALSSHRQRTLDQNNWEQIPLDNCYFKPDVLWL